MCPKTVRIGGRRGCGPMERCSFLISIRRQATLGLWLGELLIWHGREDHPWSAAGRAFTKLISSRDGLHWSPIPFAGDDGPPALFIFSQGPLRVEDELIFYYGCSSLGKNHAPGRRITGGGIFRARRRPDGFVSVDHGEFTTPKLELPAGELEVNAVGPVEVELLSEGGKTMAPTATIEGDDLRHPVRFGGRRLSDLLSDQPTRLRFRVSPTGRLYSFTVR